MSTVLEEVSRTADEIQLRVEELISLLGDDLNVGDDGVAEAVIEIENGTIKLQALLNKKRP